MESLDKKVERENCQNAEKEVVMPRTKLKFKLNKKDCQRGIDGELFQNMNIRVLSEPILLLLLFLQLEKLSIH